jgi:hypothetical protein
LGAKHLKTETVKDKYELRFKYISSLLNGMFKVSSKAENGVAFYLIWADPNNNLKI